MAAMLCMPRQSVRRAVASGELPGPRLIGGRERWHLFEVQARLSRVFALDAVERRREIEKARALEALDAWEKGTPAVRRGGKRKGT